MAPDGLGATVVQTARVGGLPVGAALIGRVGGLNNNNNNCHRSNNNTINEVKGNRTDRVEIEAEHIARTFPPAGSTTRRILEDRDVVGEPSLAPGLVSPALGAALPGRPGTSMCLFSALHLRSLPLSTPPSQMSRELHENYSTNCVHIYPGGFRTGHFTFKICPNLCLMSCPTGPLANTIMFSQYAGQQYDKHRTATHPITGERDQILSCLPHFLLIFANRQRTAAPLCSHAHSYGRYDMIMTNVLPTWAHFSIRFAFSELASAFVCRRKITCLLYTSPSPRDRQKSRMPSSA